MRASRESLVSLGKQLPQLAAELERLADRLDRGWVDTIDQIRRLLHDAVTGMCVEERVTVAGSGLATTTAMLDALLAQGKLPTTIAAPLYAIERGELTLSGDATLAMITFLEWRVGSRSGVRRGRRRRSRALVYALVAAIAAVGIAIAVVARRGGAEPLQAGDMIAIPGATFEMGSRTDEVAAAVAQCVEDRISSCELPDFATEHPRTVALSAFELDRHEVTVGELVQWLDRARPPGVTGLPNIEHGPDGRCTAKPDAAQLPATGVTWEVARAYCEAVGKRLPSEAEWELAARGAERRLYPWGVGIPTCREVVFARVYGLPCETGGFPQGQPAPVETATRDVTPEGVHDLGGNVSEWTADADGARPWCSGPCIDPRIDTGTRRVVRGGHFRSMPSQLRGASRMELAPTQSRTHIGFRCARTPGS